MGKLEQKLLAQSLRQQGLSYGEIRQKIVVSKGTLSAWCKDIRLTKEQELRLMQSKQLGQRKGSLVAAENKRNKRILRTENIQEEAKKEIGDLAKREQLIAGIALYAAEGDKTDGKGGFSNADPTLIKFMMKWLIVFAKVPPDRMRGALYLHEGLNVYKAKQFWSTITGIPLGQFIKPYVAKERSNKKFRKNIHQYGVFAIRFSDSEIHRRIMGWIYAVFDDKITLLSPVAQR